MITVKGATPVQNHDFLQVFVSFYYLDYDVQFPISVSCGGNVFNCGGSTPLNECRGNTDYILIISS